MNILNYNNGKINYNVTGEGDPIVLIHGFGLDSRIWEKQVEQLSKTNKVITYDLRGVKGDTSEWEALVELGKTRDIEALRKRILENPLFKNLKEGSRVKELINEIVNDYSGFHFMSRDPREIIEGDQEIKNISCPVDVVIGEKDEEVQKEVAKKFKNEIGVETKVIPNCGHIGILEEQELTEIIKDSSKEEFHSESSVIS